MRAADLEFEDCLIYDMGLSLYEWRLRLALPIPSRLTNFPESIGADGHLAFSCLRAGSQRASPSVTFFLVWLYTNTFGQRDMYHGG